tara:strand:- start:6017 stop:6838 length:822 start_codon:yes stop_codon:yes gene_type:complete
MSLTPEAIKHLEQTVLLTNVNENLLKIKTKSNLLVVPHGFEVSNLESNMKTRDSYRFSFATKSIKDFGEYCKEFDKEGAKCFVNSDRMSAGTIFDLGTEIAPLHQRHNAKLQLDKTAAFKALLNINGVHLSQKDAANFVEDWADNIKVLCKAGNAMTVNQASKQLREITIEQIASIDSRVDDFGESMSTMERVEAKNQDVIPATMEFTCDPYHGLSDRAFTIRVSILTGDQKPKISLRIVRLEAQEEDMAEEFKEILVGTFIESQLKTFIGEG